jgi:hypothetical protein
MMKIELMIHPAEARGNDWPRFVCEQSYHGAPHVEAAGASCPHCHASPLRVAGCKGEEQVLHGGETRYVVAACYACERSIGTLKVEHLATFFGEEEDARIFGGIWKVY